MTQHLISRAGQPALTPIALACLIALPAYAQTDTATLERVSVTGTASGLAAPAGSSSRLGLTLQQTPASVTVIDREALEARGAASTQDLLKGVPGVVFADPPGSAGSVFYRGFGASSLAQLYNGISVLAPGVTAVSATADTPGVQVNGQTTLNFTFNNNPEWQSSGTNNFGVLLTLAGYFFGNIPVVKNNLTLMLGLIVLVSFLPALKQYLKQRRAG